MIVVCKKAWYLGKSASVASASVKKTKQRGDPRKQRMSLRTYLAVPPVIISLKAVSSAKKYPCKNINILKIPVEISK